jgi:hypothetical protein
MLFCLRELVCCNCNKTFTMMHGDVIMPVTCDDCLRKYNESSDNEGVSVEDEIKKREQDRAIYSIFFSDDTNKRKINTIFKQILKWFRFK